MTRQSEQNNKNKKTIGVRGTMVVGSTFMQNYAVTFNDADDDYVELTGGRKTHTLSYTKENNRLPKNYISNTTWRVITL